MKFSIYGRFHIDVRREDEAWVAYCFESGKRTKADELIIQSKIHTGFPINFSISRASHRAS